MEGQRQNPNQTTWLLKQLSKTNIYGNGVNHVKNLPAVYEFITQRQGKYKFLPHYVMLYADYIHLNEYSFRGVIGGVYSVIQEPDPSYKSRMVTSIKSSLLTDEFIKSFHDIPKDKKDPEEWLSVSDEECLEMAINTLKRHSQKECMDIIQNTLYQFKPVIGHKITLGNLIGEEIRENLIDWVSMYVQTSQPL